MISPVSSFPLSRQSSEKTENSYLKKDLQKEIQKLESKSKLYQVAKVISLIAFSAIAIVTLVASSVGLLVSTPASIATGVAGLICYGAVKAFFHFQSKKDILDENISFEKAVKANYDTLPDSELRPLKARENVLKNRLDDFQKKAEESFQEAIKHEKAHHDTDAHYCRSIGWELLEKKVFPTYFDLAIIGMLLDNKDQELELKTFGSLEMRSFTSRMVSRFHSQNKPLLYFNPKNEDESAQIYIEDLINLDTLKGRGSIEWRLDTNMLKERLNRATELEKEIPEEEDFEGISEEEDFDRLSERSSSINTLDKCRSGSDSEDGEGLP